MLLLWTRWSQGFQPVVAPTLSEGGIIETTGVIRRLGYPLVLSGPPLASAYLPPGTLSYWVFERLWVPLL